MSKTKKKRRLKSAIANVSVDNELLREKIARLEDGRRLVFCKFETVSHSVSPSSKQLLWSGASDFGLEILHAPVSMLLGSARKKTWPQVHSDEGQVSEISQLLGRASFSPAEATEKSGARLRQKGHPYLESPRTAVVEETSTLFPLRVSPSRRAAVRTNGQSLPKLPIRCGAPMLRRRSLRRKAR